jgi:uncharacterized protein (TIRG00374 family)
MIAASGKFDAPATMPRPFLSLPRVTPFRWFLTALSFAALIGVSIYIVSGWGGASAGVSLALPPAAHLLAAAAVAAEIASRAWKITYSARAVGLRLSFGTGIRTCLGGDFGAAITPARSGAEPARYLILAEAKVSPANVLVILFAELFLEALSLAVVVAVCAVVFAGAGVVLGALVGVVGGYAAFVLGLGFAAYFISRRGTYGPPPPWARRLRLTGGRWRMVQRGLRQVRDTVNQVRSLDWTYATIALLMSIAHVAVRLAILPALVLTTHPEVPVAPLALWPFSFLYGAVVVPVPGGGGAIEVIFAKVLGDVIPHAIFGASLLWWRFYTFYVYILLGAIVAGGVVMRALRKEDETVEEFVHGS